MYRFLRFLSIFIILFSPLELCSQTTFYDLNTIQKIEIQFSQPDWDYRLDTAKVSGFETTLMADWIKINGIKLDSVGVRYKGNSSFDSTYKKNPFNIALDEYKNQSYQGVKTIKLANIFADPSMIREILSYQIAANYMDCPKANFANVYINGNLIGLYSNTETINKAFFSSRFGTSNNTFFSCSPMVKPGPTVKSNFKYINSDSSSYFNYYEIKSKYGWKDLVNLCDTVTNFPNDIDKIFDLDRVLWMMAFDNILVNLDSYIGVFAQNHYIYRAPHGLYNMILWDLNMSFGAFPYIGSGNSSMGTMSISELSKLSLDIHKNDSFWPLLKAINNNPTFKKKYIAHATTILNEFFVNNEYLNIASNLQKLIDSDAKEDPNKFFTYEQFQNGLTADYNIGTYTVPGIKNLMTARVNFILSTAEFQSSQPQIANIKVKSNNPVINSTNTISANVTNASNVFLGIKFSKKEAFKIVKMFDDGAHNDGAANDNIYGVNFNMDSIDAMFYIYAENDNAGIFSPSRAEFEYKQISKTTTGIENQYLTNEFSFFPNPVSDIIHFSNLEDNEVIKIFSNEGIKLLEVQNKTSLSLEPFAPGVYFIQKGNNYYKFVKI